MLSSLAEHKAAGVASASLQRKEETIQIRGKKVREAQRRRHRGACAREISRAAQEQDLAK
jgi:hypothetical protein